MSDIIPKHNFRDDLPLEIEIIDVKRVFQHPKEKLSSAHRISFFGIVWFETGNPTHVVDFQPLKIQPDTILFLRKDNIHSFDVITEYKAKAILFTEDFFCQNSNDIDFLNNSVLFNDLLSTPLIDIKKEKKLFTKIFNLMSSELSKPHDIYQQRIIKHHLYSLLLTSERLIQQQEKKIILEGDDYNIIVDFKKKINQFYKQEKQVNFYADLLKVSSKKLNFASSLVLGITPKQVIDSRVLLEAKRLLIHSSNSIKEISYDLGYNEPTYFVQFFKKLTGLTPLDFRAKRKLS